MLSDLLDHYLMFFGYIAGLVVVGWLVGHISDAADAFRLWRQDRKGRKK